MNTLLCKGKICLASKKIIFVATDNDNKGRNIKDKTLAAEKAFLQERQAWNHNSNL